MSSDERQSLIPTPSGARAVDAVEEAAGGVVEEAEGVAGGRTGGEDDDEPAAPVVFDGRLQPGATSNSRMTDERRRTP